MKDYLEEGDKCPDCGGEMGFEPVENCYCHNHPPCGNCINNPLICLSCGFSEEEQK